MAKEKGYIKIYRDIQDHWIWGKKPFSYGQAWIDLLLLSNYKDNKILIDGKLIEIKRGQRITSIRKLGERWGWSRTKVIDFLNHLEVDKMLSRKSDTKKTVYTIDNYGVYQEKEIEKVTPKRHRSDTEVTPKDTNNKENNDNNEKKKRIIFVKPQIEIITMYFQELGFYGDRGKKEAERFYDYYESNGWKVGRNAMKDWKAACRNWKRNSYDKDSKKMKSDIPTQASDYDASIESLRKAGINVSVGDGKDEKI